MQDSWIFILHTHRCRRNPHFQVAWIVCYSDIYIYNLYFLFLYIPSLPGLFKYKAAICVPLSLGVPLVRKLFG